MTRRQKIDTFVLARWEEWSDDWEEFAMKAISHALKERGLSQVSLFRWHRRKGGWISRWEWVVDARGHQAEERWREWIHEVRAEENPSPPVRLMWSSEDDATRVLAEMSDSDSKGPTSFLNEEMPIPVVVFFCWGESRSEVLAALDSAASWAEDHYSDAAGPTLP